jgi:hypothetical protein
MLAFLDVIASALVYALGNLREEFVRKHEQAPDAFIAEFIIDKSSVLL